MWSTTKLSFHRRIALGARNVRSQDFVSAFLTKKLSGRQFTGFGNLPELTFFNSDVRTGINFDPRHFSNKLAFRYTIASSHLTASFTTNPSIMGSIQVDESSFDAPPQVNSFDGILLDFDGTIIDSTDAIVKHWHK